MDEAGRHNYFISLPMMRKHAIVVAKQLGYDDICLNQLKEAEGEYSIDHILCNARHRKYDG